MGAAELTLCDFERSVVDALERYTAERVIAGLIRFRADLRAKGLYHAADYVRDFAEFAFEIRLQDGPLGTEWRVA